jgi:hypothetical protein
LNISTELPKITGIKKNPRNLGSISDRDIIFLLETVQIVSRPRKPYYVMYVRKSFKEGKAAGA